MKTFNVESLLHDARKRTGLSDFGPPDFREALGVLVDSLNAQSEIDGPQWDDLYERFFQRLLVNRLWFAKDLGEHPEILTEDIGSPVVIASMPRTGSTKLHRMLGASGSFQTIPLWRGLGFARMPALEKGGIAQRIDRAREFEQWIYRTSPAMLIGHPMFTNEPEEDFLLAEFTFRYSTIFAMLNVPQYAMWLMQADMRPTYDYLLAQLKYLQWQAKPAPGTSWLLKAPSHLGNEHHLSRALGKRPRLIVTHRDPVKCLPSFTTTAMAFRALYSARDSSVTLGAEGVQLFANAALQHMQWRDANPDAEVLDIAYREIDEDAPATMRKIHEFFGIPLTAGSEAAMLAWEHENRRDKYRKSAYSVESMQTTEAEIRKAFAPYTDRFANYM